MAHHTGTCEHCQKLFSRERRGGPAPRYCSASCRATAKIVRDRGNGRYAANLAELRERTQRRREAEARQCPYCGRRAVTGRRAHCGAAECTRLYRNEKQREFQRAHKTRTDRYYSNQYRVGNPPPGELLRVPAPCRACGTIIYRLKRHLSDDGLTTCESGLCQSFMRTGRWPTCDVPVGHPIRSTPVPKDHPSRKKPEWVLTGPRFVGQTCRWCGKQFLWDRLPVHGGTFEVVYCSDRCSRRAGRIRHGRFVVTDVVRQAIYARDGWCCRLCGGRLARDKRTPHPKAPTLDHIVPRSRGGSDDSSNLQAAHFICNVLKSDGVSGSTGDQLALLG